MSRLTRAELVDLVRRLVESLGDGGLSRATVIEAKRALKAEEAALTVDHEADAMFDALQPSLGTPVPPERRIRRQADVDAAFARGVESMLAEPLDSATPVVEWETDAFGNDYVKNGNVLSMVAQSIDGRWGWETQVEGYTDTEAEAKSAAIAAARGVK